MPVDKSYIGRTGAPVTMHVERGKIREFARAIKDDDPMYFDEAHAAREVGGIIVSRRRGRQSLTTWPVSIVMWRARATSSPRSFLYSVSVTAKLMLPPRLPGFS
jgi:hypothetical protein